MLIMLKSNTLIHLRNLHLKFLRLQEQRGSNNFSQDQERERVMVAAEIFRRVQALDNLLKALKTVEILKIQDGEFRITKTYECCQHLLEYNIDKPTVISFVRSEHARSRNHFAHHYQVYFYLFSEVVAILTGHFSDSDTWILIEKAMVEAVYVSLGGSL